MRRRDFIKKASLATAGAFVAPYILPSGRLFAATGAQKAKHVVFCLFAGGVRNLESIQKKEGNLMPYTFSGTESISPDIIGGMTPLAAPPGLPLQSYGTLFKDFRYKQGPTGHYNGHTTAITGVYTHTDLDLKAHPESPTIFEYYRKHTSPVKTSLNAWWLSNSLGPYPALNYSKDTGYGAIYGANYIQPASIISLAGYDVLGNPKTFNTTEEASIKKLRQAFDNNFGIISSVGDAGVTNTSMDAASVESFIAQSFTKALGGQYTNPWGISGGMNNDMFTMLYAEEIIDQFKPELLVVNMQGVDVCHTDFTQYCNNMRMADYALSHLWNKIQSTPGMANDTVLIVAPEHGRNQQSNSLRDAFGRYAIDHTSDNTSREIFCLVVGPPGTVKQGQVITNASGEGESIDIVPTIADVLGFYNDIPLTYRNAMGSPLAKAFI